MKQQQNKKVVQSTALSQFNGILVKLNNEKEDLILALNDKNNQIIVMENAIKQFKGE